MSTRRKRSGGRPDGKAPLPRIDTDAVISQVDLETGCGGDVATAAVRAALRATARFYSQHGASITDPRHITAMSHVGEADPSGYGQGDHLVDTSRAVLPDYIGAEVVVTAQADGDSRDAYAITFEGRINQSDDRARVLLLMPDEDDLAIIAAEVAGVAYRSGRVDAFMKAFDRRVEATKGTPPSGAPR